MEKRRLSKDASRVALQVAEGVFGSAIDLTLWTVVYFSAFAASGSRGSGAWKARVSADRFLHQFNYDVIKRGILTAKRSGFIRASRRHAWPQITKEGLQRLQAVLPVYDEKRTWDGRMHIITYDIPEKRRQDRDLLRVFLRRMGCGRLQDSVWITPYNPIDTVRSFIDEKQLRGTIIISDMGRDGSIGEEDVQGLVARVYKLDEINGRYEDFLFHERQDEHFVLIQFFSILRDDPQLPFALLPPWWKGSEAYQKVEPLLRKVPFYFRP